MYFFCGGPIKSGTTLLQRVLDSHPQISCQPEHYLNGLFKSLIELGHSYNNKITQIAEIMGQSPSLLENNSYLEAFYLLIQEIFLNGDKEINGINDNDFIINNAQILLDRFEDSKIIYILRNPIDTSLSTWDHQIRLYKKNHDPELLKELTFNKQLNRDEFVIKRSREWGELASKILNNLEKNPDKVIVITYENLVTNKLETLESIFTFLGANFDKDTISNIIKNSSLEKMRNNSSNPEFYSKGRYDFGKSVLDKIIIKDAIIVAGKSFNSLGYEIEYTN